MKNCKIQMVCNKYDTERKSSKSKSTHADRFFTTLQSLLALMFISHHIKHILRSYFHEDVTLQTVIHKFSLYFLK